MARPVRWRTVPAKTGPTVYDGPQDPPRNISGLTAEHDVGSRIRDTQTIAEATAPAAQPKTQREQLIEYYAAEYEKEKAAQRQADIFAEQRRVNELKAAEAARVAAAAEAQRKADIDKRLDVVIEKERMLNTMFIVSNATPSERFAVEAYAEKKGFALDAARMEATLAAFRWNGNRFAEEN